MKITTWVFTFHIPKIWQILKHLARQFHQAQTSYFLRVFIGLFVAAFPLAPLFALINNVIEIRVDAYKYVTTLRRPLAQRVENIGAWANILQTLTYISVFTNVSISISIYNSSDRTKFSKVGF